MPRIKDFFRKSFLYLKTHKKLLIIPFILIPILIFVLYPRNKEEIETYKVTSTDLVQSISSNGTIQSENSVKLSFLVGGKLTYLAGKEGDLIGKGGTLATLDQRSVKKNIDNALLDYSKQRNVWDQSLDNNNINTVSEAANDTIKRALENNQYDLNKTVLSVELQDLAREQTVLTSPINGMITRLDAKTTGVNVTPTTIFEITDPNSLVFEIEIDEADIGKVQEGQSASVVLDAYPDETLNLAINHIDFNTHPTSTGGDAYYIKGSITFDNTGYKYRAGMNGTADIILDKKTDVITIPLSSVFEDNKVYVKNGKKYDKKTIKLGVQNDVDVEVLEGLSVGDEVVTDPESVK